MPNNNQGRRHESHHEIARSGDQARQRSSRGRSRSRNRQSRPINARNPRSLRHPYSSNHNFRTISGHDTGYTLHQRNINFNGRREGRRGPDRRMLFFLIAALLVLVLLVLAISSCVRGCSSSTTDSEDEVNSQDSRVAAGASSGITTALTPALNVADNLNKIAQNADKYSDTRMIELAVSEPDAVEFVANYPDADKSAQTFTDSVTKGSYPALYDWDSRWGNIDYADGAFGITGSGPTVLSMAYMGLTGSSDKTPATIADIATSAGYANGDAGLSSDFFDNTLAQVGLAGHKYTPSGDNISLVLEDGAPLAVLVKANTLTSYAHWVLVSGTADDGSVYVNDPTSATVSSHTWAASTISSDADTMYALSATDNSGDAGSSE